MTQNARQFLSFIGFAVGWSLVCRLFIGVVHPVAIFGIWLFGFVWAVGYIISGRRTADYLVLVWLAPPAIFAVLVYLASVLIEMA